jgi:hypothetical protein
MNLAVNTTSANTWQTIKRHYLSAITLGALSGLALFGAFTVAQTATDVGTPSSAVTALKPQTAVSRPAITSWPAMTYYIVDSHEMMLALETEVRQQQADNALYAPNRHWQYSILLATTPAETEDALGIVEQAKARWKAADASGLEIVDLRAR